MLVSLKISFLSVPSFSLTHAHVSLQMCEILMKGYSWSRADFREILYSKYIIMEEEKINGCLWTWEKNTDYLLSGDMLKTLPELKPQDTQIYEYNQGSTANCTLLTSVTQ